MNAGWTLSGLLVAFVSGVFVGHLLGSPTIVVDLGVTQTDVAPYCSDQPEDALRCWSDTATIGIRG